MSYTYKYPRPAVTVDTIVFNKRKNEILLIKRGKYPFEGNWALPGGFVDMDEELEIAALRELKEETSLNLDKVKQFKAYGTIGRDPRHRTISVIFYTIANESKIVKANDDASDAQWFNLNSLPELAFDHKEIIEDFIKRHASIQSASG